jgi:restriction system protein
MQRTIYLQTAKMPIPTYDQLLRPLLELAAQGDLTRRYGTEVMIRAFNLTPAETEQRLLSGGATYIRNRVGWAMSFLTKGGLIAKVAPKTYRVTDFGKEFLQKHPQTIAVADFADLEAIPGWEEAWQTKAKRREREGAAAAGSEAKTTATPYERIDAAFSELRESLISDLRSQLARIDPFRFEEVVLDLLVKMGYGGSVKEAAAVTQKTGDEGIDGVINEDRLGLDVIYIQAKRWKNNVGRQEIQNFVGALAGKKASKGVFITTSAFNGNAREYPASLHQKVILIDGRRLAELMIEHDIGVAEEHAYSVKKIDSDYFDDT